MRAGVQVYVRACVLAGVRACVCAVIDPNGARSGSRLLVTESSITADDSLTTCRGGVGVNSDHVPGT